MTIYIPRVAELPLAQMRLLDPSADFSTVEESGLVSAYIYDWPDLRVIVHVGTGSDLSTHLDGFIGWCRSVAETQCRLLDRSLEKRIRSTTLSLGFVIEKSHNRDVWFDRVQDMIAMICSNTHSLLFWEGAVYDDQCQELLGPSH